MNEVELQNIFEFIEPRFERYFSLYDYNKYPANDYRRFKEVFRPLKIPMTKLKMPLSGNGVMNGKVIFLRHSEI